MIEQSKQYFKHILQLELHIYNLQFRNQLPGNGKSEHLIYERYIEIRYTGENNLEMP